MREFMDSETRFAMLKRSHPEAAEQFLRRAQEEADARFKAYQTLAQGPIPDPKTGA
jgi:pyruvate-ferredoxin/flavodoxin oxidoreductase